MIDKVNKLYENQEQNNNVNPNLKYIMNHVYFKVFVVFLAIFVIVTTIFIIYSMVEINRMTSFDYSKLPRF